MTALMQRPLAWLAAAALVAVVAAAVAFAVSRPAQGPALTTVGIHDMRAALAEGALALDVREPFEFDEGRVAGVVLVPLATVASRTGDFDRDAPVYVFCRSGNRSLVAAQTLVDAGYRDVRNVDGGMIAWAAAGLPIER